MLKTLSKFHTLVVETIIPRPIEEVFRFFSNAENLQLITPANLHFRFLSHLPIEMKQGAIIDYKIRINRIPVRWQTEIIEWQSNQKFVDTQKKGPYRLWVHEHYFEKRGDKTYMRDTVKYLSPGWIFEPLIHHLYVKKQVENIFAFRTQKIAELF